MVTHIQQHWSRLSLAGRAIVGMGAGGVFFGAINMPQHIVEGDWNGLSIDLAQIFGGLGCIYIGNGAYAQKTCSSEDKKWKLCAATIGYLVTVPLAVLAWRSPQWRDSFQHAEAALEFFTFGTAMIDEALRPAPKTAVISSLSPKPPN